MSFAGGGGQEYASERELLYKILFDMRSDINELKRMLSSVLQGQAVHTPQPAEMRNYLPQAVVDQPAEVVDYAESEVVVDEPQRERTKADMQREQILQALKNNKGRRRDAARDLFLSERTLYRRMRDLGITDEDI
jgi:DNA-binding NtrC family response regulator